MELLINNKIKITINLPTNIDWINIPTLLENYPDDESKITVLKKIVSKNQLTGTIYPTIINVLEMFGSDENKFKAFKIIKNHVLLIADINLLVDLIGLFINDCFKMKLVLEFNHHIYNIKHPFLESMVKIINSDKNKIYVLSILVPKVLILDNEDIIRTVHYLSGSFILVDFFKLISSKSKLSFDSVVDIMCTIKSDQQNLKILDVLVSNGFKVCPDQLIEMCRTLKSTKSMTKMIGKIPLTNNISDVNKFCEKLAQVIIHPTDYINATDILNINQKISLQYRPHSQENIIVSGFLTSHIVQTVFCEHEKTTIVYSNSTTVKWTKHSTEYTFINDNGAV
ncbi:hypothetical protein QJ850_gp210 [Acanthamoeba polyphaga mimivirus]|uniref:Uncharacterized protein n=1 Tax=Acanthamoeba polyphaga mimivirus Kroon TaxID=3069720 RepID=A0A0G2Y7C1_9VIRU|nr:hypothetical protein QJ850_gp210 [Acanthamoeba polyphaga mimivirus]AKI80489.1 hypothetical protein [Acanthamoeba polyphaga mimivirus Kroon]